MFAIAVAIAASMTMVSAQNGRQERVSFTAGTSSATLDGSIAGDEMVDYVLGARRGQTMSVTLKTSNDGNYFNVLPPGSQAAIAIGSTVGHEWTGDLPADGDYTIRIYLMPSAARRNEKATYTLSVSITGAGDVTVAGTPYHATGMVPCSVGPDPKGSAQCSYGVIRTGPGLAEVHLAPPGFDVTLHKDQLRTLRFAGDTVTSADASEKVSAEKLGDHWSIAVNDFYFYTVPEAVILGG
jgi:hypothetical protein